MNMENMIRMKKAIVPFVLGASASMAILKCVDSWKSSRANFQPDLKFIKNAIQSGAAEVAFGELGMKQGASTPVKNFAKMLVNDHQKVNDQLTKILKKKNADFEISADTDRNLEKISKLSDAAFDKSFVQAVVENHTRVIRFFEQQADKGKDTELKNWATRTLPMLQKHLEHARELLETFK